MKNTNSSEAFFCGEQGACPWAFSPKKWKWGRCSSALTGPLILRRSRAGITRCLACSSCILPVFYGSIEDDPLLFFKGFICVIFNYTYMSVYMCKWGQVPAESRGHRSPRVGHSGSCELPSWVLQTYLRSPERTEPSLQRALTPHS